MVGFSGKAFISGAPLSPPRRPMPFASRKSFIADAISTTCVSKRLQHFAFEYRNLDDLLGTYVRLKQQGILPVLCTDSGAQTAFYYEDSDRNSVKLNVDNYGDSWTSTEHLRNSPDFAKNPMGKYVDPDRMVAAREAGASPWELHERAWAGEFAPAKPYDLRVLL